MISPEQLVSQLTDRIEKLVREKVDLENEVKEVLELAETWRDNYNELNANYKRDIGNRDQTISQLQEELDQAQGILGDIETRNLENRR